MKTNILRKLFAKIATLGIVVSMLTPLAGAVKADLPTAHLGVGVNVSTGYLAVYMDPDYDDPITSGYGSDYSYNSSEGYYTVDRYNQDQGDYTIRFNPTTTDGYVVSKIYVNGVEQEPYIDTVSGMVTVYLDLNSDKTVYAYYDFPSTESHMISLGVNVSQGYMELYSAADMTTPIMERYGYNCTFDSTEGYYTCPRYDQDEGDYVARFNPTTTDGYILKEVYVNGVEVTPYDSAGMKAVYVDLDQDKTIFAYYDYPSTDTHMINVGVNVSQGYMEMYYASDMSTPVMDKYGYECTFDSTEGYYTCPRYDQDADDYVVRFNSTTTDGYVLTDIFVNGASVTPYNSDGMDAVYVELDEDKTVFAYYDYPSEETYDLSVGVNLAEGGFTITETETDIVVMDKDGSECSFADGYYTCTAYELPVTLYTITFHDIAGDEYITPSTIYVDLDEDKFIPGYYSTFPSGTIQVEVIDEFGVEIADVPTGHWELQSCVSENPSTCSDVMMTGGPGSIQEELQYGWYRLFVDDTPISGYTNPDIYNSLNDTPAAELTAEDDFIAFTLQYEEEGDPEFVDMEIRARKTPPGNLTAVEYYYCIGDIASPSTLACEGPFTTTSTVQAITDSSAEQGIFISREAGFQTPYNEDIGSSDLAQDVTVTGFEDYYYYPFSAEALSDERVTMAYDEVPPEAIINVAVSGPAAMASAEISISGSIASHVEIDNGDNQDFPVNSSIDYTVTCHDVTGYFTLTPTIDVEDLMVGETRYVECLYADDVAFVNLGTLTNESTPQPLAAQATLVVTDPSGIDNQTQVTSVEDTDGANTYMRLSRSSDTVPNNVENRFVLETDTTGYTPNVDGYIQCMPAPGGFHAPDNVLQINNLHILSGEEDFAGLCEYYEVSDDEKTTIHIDTIGVEEAAIYVDGVEVRDTDDSDEVEVTITTEEEHVITFEDKDPANFRTPDPITIPAGTLDSSMSPHYLGYYVELGYETIVEIDTINESGFAYMKVGSDDTLYMVGYATPTDTITMVVDNRNYHEFSFQDKNSDVPPYILRAVPAAGCSIVTNTPETLTTVDMGTYVDVTRFQEYYICDGTSTTLPGTISLTGHYIAKTDAGFFRAKTTNTETDINGDITLTLGEPDVDEVTHPGSNTWTRIFVSDVQNDTDDQVEFESPITVSALEYIADPVSYTLSDYSAGSELHELTSTYILDEGLVDVAIRLVSFDPLIQPTEGLAVVMDEGGIDETTENTVLDGSDIEAQFSNVDSTADHVFECPVITGLNTPNTVYVPAGTMTDGAENVFYCLYSSAAGGAEIQILTTASDQINLEASITLDVDGTDYAIGYTDGSVTTDEANMELWVETTLTNTIEYGDVAGYLTPAPEVVTAAAGTSYLDYGTDPATNPNMYLGEYTRGGTVNVYTIDEVVTDPTVSIDGAMIQIVRESDSVVIAETLGGSNPGMLQDVMVDADTDYRIEFGAHPTDSEYATPLPIYFNLSSGEVSDFIGVYTKNSCQVDLRREDINTGDPLAAEVTLSVNGGADYSLGTGDPANDYLVSFLIDQTQANGTYEFTFVPLAAPLDVVNPPTLSLPTDSMTCPVEQTIYYGTDLGGDEATFVITLLEQTTAEDPVSNADVTLNGANVETSDTLGQVTFTDVEVDEAITFSFANHPTDPTNFVTPLDLVYPADYWAADETHEITVYYVPADCAVILNISTVDESNTSVNVNGEINLQTNSDPEQFIGVGTAIVNACFNDSVSVIWGPAADTAAYALPAVNPEVIDFTGVSAGDTIDVEGLYRPIGAYTPLDFTVQAADQNSNELNPTFTYEGVPGTAPHSFQVMYEDLDSYTIAFNDLDGYTAPNDVVVTNRVIAVPDNVTVTLNGTDYVSGTELQEDDDVVITATYLTSVTISKTVSAESIAGNNVRADYIILITNNSGSDIDVTVHDTISDTSGTLYGSNGGTMTIVTQNGDNTVCYNPSDTTIPLSSCPDIVAGDETFTVGDTPVMITYQLLSNNSGIPSGQSSTFSNTASATYTDGSTITVDADANVNVAGPSSGSGDSSGGSSSTGGGGGHVLIKGDMELEVEKLVSLDGTNYVDASDTDAALGIPTNKDSRVYVKVRLTNVGKVSAVDIEYKQEFEEGESAMTAGDPENVEGVDDYDEDTKVMEIDLIPVNSTQEFTYEIMVYERGANGEYARDDIELLGFESRLPASQDQMTYMGIGDKYPSYMIAGENQSNVSEDEFLRVTVESDKDEANIGDIVNFLITAENISDEDLTGLMIAHDYDEDALEILNVYGGRDDGREVSWTRAILRPGETATFQVQARVGSAAPVGDYVTGTTRSLVDQSDGIAPVPNSIYIIGGVQLAETGAMQLAQTGPGMILLLLLTSLLAYFGYNMVTRQRYAMIKKAALRPL